MTTLKFGGYDQNAKPIIVVCTFLYIHPEMGCTNNSFFSYIYVSNLWQTKIYACVSMCACICPYVCVHTHKYVCVCMYAYVEVSQVNGH